LEDEEEEFSLTTGSIRPNRKTNKDDDDKQLVEYSAGIFLNNLLKPISVF
jgi:hypothetical protein